MSFDFKFFEQVFTSDASTLPAKQVQAIVAKTVLILNKLRILCTSHSSDVTAKEEGRRKEEEVLGLKNDWLLPTLVCGKRQGLYVSHQKLEVVPSSFFPLP
ncbi:MAG: hypothetical protein AAFX46_18500 [Cyanobacteria bacterium J06636_27]